MKKKLIGFILMFTFVLGFCSAGKVNVNNVSNKTSQCRTNESQDVYYYITGNNIEMYPFDSMHAAQDAILNTTNSSVEIWRNGVILSGSCNNWNNVSNFIKGNDTNDAVIIKSISGCKFGIPNYLKTGNNASAIDAQIHYTIGYNNTTQYPIAGVTNQITAKFFYRYLNGTIWYCSNGGAFPDWSSCTQETLNYIKTPVIHTGECLNYRVFRCGDGLVNGRLKNGTTITNYTNGAYTEQCDPNDPNHTNWGSNGCTATCEPDNYIPPVEDPTTCEITINPSSITLGETATVSYTISGNFIAPLWLQVSPQMIQGSWPYPINGNTNSITVGPEIPGIGTYTFWIPGHSNNGDFSCRATLTVVDNQPQGTTGLSIVKSIESVGPFNPGDEIRYKIVATNTGTMTGYGLYVRDLMPEYVSYLTSSIYFIPSSNQHPNFGQWTSGSRDVFEYSGITLAPGQQIVIILTGLLSGLPQSTFTRVSSVASHMSLCDGFISEFNTKYYNAVTMNCAVVGGSGYDEDEDCAEFPVPYMVKTQSVRGIDYTHDEVVVATDEIITYRVDFGNKTGAMMTNVLLKDDMPNCVSYLTSTVYGIHGYTFSTGVNPLGNTTIYYSGFNLASGQTGYMLLTGKISNSTECQSVSRYRNDAYLIYSGGYISDYVVAKRPRITVIKEGDRPHYNLNDPINFHITVINNGPETAYDILLQDIWPNFPAGCVNYDGWTGTNGLDKVQNTMDWNYPGAFNPGEKLDLYLSGTIGSNPECITDYVNTVLLDYTDGSGHHYTGQDNYPFDVTGSDAGFLSKVVDHNTVTNGDTVVWTITYKNNGIVDWDTGYTLTDNWPRDVLDYISSDCTGTCSESHEGKTYSFTFNEVLHPGEVKTLVLKGRVKTGWENKKWNYVELDYHTIFGNRHLTSGDWIAIKDEPVVPSKCGNGTLEGTEECDGGYKLESYKTGIFYIWDYLDYNRKTPATGDKAHNSYYCTESCKLERLGGDSYNIPSCLNVDTTISIMEGEIFPFWWRIWMREGIQFVNKNNCKSYTSNSKSDTKINKDSMKCTFSVYDGKGYNQAKKEPIKTFTVPCFSGRDSSLNQYFKPFDNESCEFSRCVDFDKVASRQAWNVSTLLRTGINTYGEYKLALEKVEYDYCASDGTWKKGKLYDSVCEVNFALTKPYLMQINTAGVPQATSTNFLNNFYDIEGHKIETDINNVITTTDSSYDTNVDVSSQISQFKKKYESLAVAVSTLNWNGASSVKKVPGKSIYFVKGDGDLTITKSVSKFPFTILVEGMDVVIDGSININGMIITNKTISFKDSGCGSGGQVVQGIFIAQGGFTENKSTQNIDINRPRCHRGNLKVKGVLIGKNILNIVESKRAQLNSRFQTSIPYDETDELKAERRTKIINGASLLIEYNPDLWSKTIPGSEIFTQTLNVYKK